MRSVEARDQSCHSVRNGRRMLIYIIWQLGPLVKMTAPGANILSTTSGTGYAMDSRTSMTAPFVIDYVAMYKPRHPCSILAEMISGIFSQDSKPD